LETFTVFVPFLFNLIFLSEQTYLVLACILPRNHIQFRDPQNLRNHCPLCYSHNREIL